MSVGLDIRPDGDALRRLERFQEAVEAGVPDLLDHLGGVLVAQTRFRIEDEKRSPEGDDWQAWSDDYEARRPAGRSLLYGEGDLEESIEAFVQGEELILGSDEPYAAVHQFGSEGDGPIPARPYLGISAENAAALDEEIGDWLARVGRVR